MQGYNPLHAIFFYHKSIIGILFRLYLILILRR